MKPTNEVTTPVTLAPVTRSDGTHGYIGPDNKFYTAEEAEEKFFSKSSTIQDQPQTTKYNRAFYIESAAIIISILLVLLYVIKKTRKLMAEKALFTKYLFRYHLLTAYSILLTFGMFLLLERRLSKGFPSYAVSVEVLSIIGIVYIILSTKSIFKTWLFYVLNIILFVFFYKAYAWTILPVVLQLMAILPMLCENIRDWKTRKGIGK